MISFGDYVQEQARLDANFDIEEGVVGAVKHWIQDKKYDIQDKISDAGLYAAKFHSFVAGAKSLRWHKKYNYTKPQRDAIFQYTVDSSDVNRNLIKHGTPHAPLNTKPGTPAHHWAMEARNNQSFIHNNLSDAIRSNKAHKNMKVFTGISQAHAEKIWNTFQHHNDPHSDVTLKPFTSTSVSKGIANQFAKGHNGGTASGAATLKIHVPKGSHVVFIPKHDSAMNDDTGVNEGEVILHHGAKIRVKRNVRKGPLGHFHFEAHLIHDGIKKTKYHPEYDHRDNAKL